MEQLFFIVGLGRKWGITELVAFGHKHIANYLILENRLVMARKYLTSCILLNKKLKNNDELLESLYLHGSCQAHLHFKEYIQLMLNTPTPEHPGFKKILEFITYGKPFWEVKNLKRYIVTKQIKPLIAHEKPLAASDKIYIVLKGIFGQEFADYAMEEITKFSNKVPFDQNCYLQEDPTECKYFEVREDAEDYRKFLQDKYQDRNKVLEKLYGENIFFEIEEREIEDDSEDVEYIKSMNAIDPIIPYAKDSPMHQQALNLIKKCTGRENVGKKKKVIIDATDPKVLIRLLNCIKDQGNVVFQFKGPINYEAIIQEMRRQREEQRKFVHSLPDLLHKRYSSEMPEQPVKKAVSIPFPQDDYDENYLEYETDEEIEKNRDILFNQDPSIMEKIISITKYMNENK